MLDIQNLTKTFNKTTAVDGVDLSVSESEVYALIGPNGSGKTTLMKMVAGLLQPTAGDVNINGIDALSNPTEAKSKIGYIPDNPTVWNQMTGREFLHFTGALYGIEQKEREQRIKKLLPHFQLSGVENTYFEHYSRGNRQKFTILAALLHEPDLLLIDEPIVGLDPESVETLEQLLLDFSNDGGAVFITTHTLPVAEHIADTLGVLDAGQLRADGSEDELKDRAELDQHATVHDIYHSYTGKTLKEQ